VARHKERLSAVRRDHYRRNLERYKEADRRYREKNRDKRIAYQREYYQKNREWHLAYKLTYQRKTKIHLLDHTYDGIEYEIWKRHESHGRTRVAAMAQVQEILDAVSPEAQAAAERYMSEGAAMPSQILSELRKAAGL